MSKLKPAEALSRVVPRILEQAAFLFPEPVENPDEFPLENHELVMATIDYSGDCNGRMAMIVPFELCSEISSNMLGEEIEETNFREKVLDAFKEVLNIITGQMLTEVYGDKAVCNLQAPEVREISADETRKLMEEGESTLSISDDSPIITVLKQAKESDEHQSISR